MKVNIGNPERMIRLILGAVLLALGIFGPFHMYVQVALVAAGIIAVLTAAIRFCPAWAAFGVNTCRK